MGPRRCGVEGTICMNKYALLKVHAYYINFDIVPDKCLLPYYGGCHETRMCVSARDSVSCGACFPGRNLVNLWPLFDACGSKDFRGVDVNLVFRPSLAKFTNLLKEPGLTVRGPLALELAAVLANFISHLPPVE